MWLASCHLFSIATMESPDFPRMMSNGLDLTGHVCVLRLACGPSPVPHRSAVRLHLCLQSVKRKGAPIKIMKAFECVETGVNLQMLRVYMAHGETKESRFGLWTLLMTHECS